MAWAFAMTRARTPPVCRWLLASGIKLDLMPTKPEVLGFSNRWFSAAFDHALEHELSSGAVIRVVTGPYFLATKLEAFHDRGGGDYMASKDMEDLVAVLHGRSELVAEIERAEGELREYLAGEARALLEVRAFEEALEGHLPGEDLTRVMGRLRRIASAGS